MTAAKSGNGWPEPHIWNNASLLTWKSKPEDPAKRRVLPMSTAPGAEGAAES